MTSFILMLLTLFQTITQDKIQVDKALMEGNLEVRLESYYVMLAEQFFPGKDKVVVFKVTISNKGKKTLYFDLAKFKAKDEFGIEYPSPSANLPRSKSGIHSRDGFLPSGRHETRYLSIPVQMDAHVILLSYGSKLSWEPCLLHDK